MMMDSSLLRTAVAAALIAVSIALQFVPLYEARLAPLFARYRWLRALSLRSVQLIAGFFLLAGGIELLGVRADG